MAKKEHSKVGAVIILIISAIVFLPAGGAAVYQGLFNKNSAPVFGSYGNKKITYEPNSQLQRATRNITNYYKRLGMDVNDQMFGYVLYQAYQETLKATFYESQVKKSGWKVSDEDVKKQLVQLYSDETGKFYADAYKQADDVEIQQLTTSIKDSLVFTRYEDDVYGSQSVVGGKNLYGVKTNLVEETYINTMSSVRKSFQVASFDTSVVPPSIINNYMEQNLSNFDNYPLQAITCDEKKDAAKVLKNLKAEKVSFEEALEQNSERYYTDYEGNLTGSYDYQLADLMENEKDIQKVKALVNGEYSPVIKTRVGYTIFRMNGEVEKANVKSARLYSVVENYIRENEIFIVEDYYIDLGNKLVEETKTTSFAAAARKYGATVTTVENAVLNSDGSSLLPPAAEAFEGTNKNVLTKVFALNDNEVSEPLAKESEVVIAKCTKTSFDTNFVVTSDQINSVTRSSGEGLFKKNDKVVDNFYDGYSKLMAN